MAHKDLSQCRFGGDKKRRGKMRFRNEKDKDKVRSSVEVPEARREG